MKKHKRKEPASKAPPGRRRQDGVEGRQSEGVAPAKATKKNGHRRQFILPPDRYVVHYTQQKEFFVEEDGRVTPYTEGGLKMFLRNRGLSTKHFSKGALLNEVEEVIQAARERDVVDYVGPVAGHPVGLYVYNGHRIVVSKAPEVTPATHGGNRVVWEFVEALLGAEQAAFVHAWVKLSRAALLAGDYRRFMALIVAGEPGQGKTVLGQAIQRCFNGTMADCYKFMSGESGFNGDLFANVLLWADDKGSNPRIESRRNLTNSLKQFTAGGIARCEAKYKEAVALDPFWRVLLTLNQSTKCLQVLPEMDRELLDKIITLKTVKKACGPSTFQPLMAGVSDYLGQLEAWSIPDELRDERYGLKAYQHPDIVKGAQALSPETQLLDLLFYSGVTRGPSDDDANPGVMPGEWVKTPDGCMITTRELYYYLRMLGDAVGNFMTKDADRLLRSKASLGMYLEQLSNSHPHRVVRTGQRVPGGGPQLWLLRKPSPEDAD